MHQSSIAAVLEAVSTAFVSEAGDATAVVEAFTETVAAAIIREAPAAAAEENSRRSLPLFVDLRLILFTGKPQHQGPA